MMELRSYLPVSECATYISDWARSQLLSQRSIIWFGPFKQQLFFNAALNHYHKIAKVSMVSFYTNPRFPAQWNYHGNDAKKN